MSDHGVDISRQQSRLLVPADFQQFDGILVMDESNYSDVLELARNEDERAKVEFFMPDNSNVPDPYFGGHAGFELVYTMLHGAANDRISTWVASEARRGT